jgi:hypothetical protein
MFTNLHAKAPSACSEYTATENSSILKRSDILIKVRGSKKIERTYTEMFIVRHNLYFSPSIIRMIKSRRIRWAGHVARMVRRGIFKGYWCGSQKERDH